MIPWYFSLRLLWGYCKSRALKGNLNRHCELFRFQVWASESEYWLRYEWFSEEHLWKKIQIPQDQCSLLKDHISTSFQSIKTFEDLCWRFFFLFFTELCRYFEADRPFGNYKRLSDDQLSTWVKFLLKLVDPFKVDVPWVIRSTVSYNK